MIILCGLKARGGDWIHVKISRRILPRLVVIYLILSISENLHNERQADRLMKNGMIKTKFGFPNN